MTPERWRKVEGLYHKAREWDVTLRAAYLHEVCAGDDSLRQEVESLLAQEAEAGSFLEVSPLKDVAAQAAHEAKLFETDPAQSQNTPPEASQEQSPFDSAQGRQVKLVGRQLGSYLVRAKIGAGGMGDVYRAFDTKLRRDVALKVLPKPFARNPESLARFRREAQLLASLNHKNVAAIYGFEELPEANFLVLELIEGETFAERIKRQGPLPVKDALTLAGQVAEGLEAAHRKGITHRDIKPANIKVTPEGEVKVLDFGLAKAFAGGRANADLSELPTLEPGPTKDGQILGTPAYMSPEQVRGQDVDKRTDIWAFGCVLFELLTGQRPFRGGTIHDTISKVLDGEPDWAALPPATPATMRTLLRRCLQKDANRRLHDIADARIEIEEALTAPATGELNTTAPIPTRPGWRRAMPWAVALVLSVVIGLAVWTLKPAPPQPVTRSVINLPPGDRLPPAEQRALALSPDGKLLAYVAIHDGLQQLYLRAMDGFEAKEVSGTEGATAPFFSPDSQWVGFFAGGKLKKVSVSGGAAVTIGEAPVVTLGQGASWGNNDTVAFQGINLGGLSQVSAAGGAVQRLTTLDKGEFIHRWPEFLPGSGAVLFNASPNNLNWTTARIAAYFPGTGQRRNLVQAGVSPRYAPDGRLIYAQGGTLMAAPFDAKRLEVTGPAVPVVEGVSQSAYSGNAQYALSAATGTLVYVSGRAQDAQSKLVWVSRNGTEQPLLTPARAYGYHRLSPDGKRVAVTVTEQETQVWTYDLARETLTRLTFEGSLNTVPAWTPDGQRIAFGSTRAGPQNLFWQLAGGSGGIERLTTSEYLNSPASWSPDGQLLAYLEVHPTTGFDLWVLRLSDPRQAGAEGHKAQPFLRTPFTESAPKFSPDGHWLAYVSDESGRWEIYVQPYPGPGGKWQVSTEGGTEPVWNPNGRELFYRSGDKMMVVEVEVGQASTPVSSGQAGRPVATGFSAGKPRVLFEAGQYLPTPVMFPNYDVSPDGQRFLMLKPSEQQGQAATQINVVLNWFEELKRRVPAAR